MSPVVRVFNPLRPNAGKPKVWTYQQAEDRKEKAEWAARELQGDDERGDELADMSVEQYAEERGFELLNPSLGGTMQKKKVSQEASNLNPALVFEREDKLREQIRRLQQEKDSLAGKLSAIEEIVECDDPDCEPEDHLAEIEDLVVEKKGHGEEEED